MAAKSIAWNNHIENTDMQIIPSSNNSNKFSTVFLESNTEHFWANATMTANLLTKFS